jgi:hypothetical protein
MTEKQILELATYHFFDDGADEWSGTSEGIVEFAKAIQDKLLKKLIVQLEGELNEND